MSAFEKKIMDEKAYDDRDSRSSKSYRQYLADVVGKWIEKGREMGSVIWELDEEE